MSDQLDTQTMDLKVNGQPSSVQAGPGEMLSVVLRYQLGLTGTKIACEEAECGTCTVLVNGQPVLSCVYPAQKLGRLLPAVVTNDEAADIPTHDQEQIFLQNDLTVNHLPHRRDR